MQPLGMLKHSAQACVIGRIVSEATRAKPQMFKDSLCRVFSVICKELAL